VPAPGQWQGRRARGAACRDAWAFGELRLPRVEWATEVGNAASLRAAVKAGFAFEGRRRASLRQRDGSLHDGWWAARLPADGPEGVAPALPDPARWPSRRAPAARWWVAERSQEDWAAGDGAPLAVLGDDGEVLGSLQLLLKGRRRGIAEVGVWVHPSARQGGTATAAITAMLAWAEPALGLSRVEWHAAPDNAGSGSAARAWPAPRSPPRRASRAATR
jgi:RimJ/RimL family protein N-acetyltransferase